jgi:hypothetical protein
MLLEAAVVKVDAELICLFCAGNCMFIDPSTGIGFETEKVIVITPSALF